MNTISLTGRLGSEPEIKYFDSGASVAKVSLAVDNPRHKDQPSWFNLEMWEKTAEVAANYTRKGSLIGIEGELRLETWTDKDGTHRAKPVVRVKRLHLLEKKQQETQTPVPDHQVSMPAALANF